MTASLRPRIAWFALLGLVCLGAGCWPERPPPSTFAELCANGTDDDDDGLADCADSDCSAACNGTQTPRELVCDDGRDDEPDGLVDCQDPDCAVTCEDETESDCQDGEDDDGDGEVDCSDFDCAGELGCE